MSGPKYVYAMFWDDFVRMNYEKFGIEEDRVKILYDLDIIMTCDLLKLTKNDLRFLPGNMKVKVWHAIERMQEDPAFSEMLRIHERRKRTISTVPANNQLRALLAELRAS